MKRIGENEGSHRGCSTRHAEHGPRDGKRVFPFLHGLGRLGFLAQGRFQLRLDNLLVQLVGRNGTACQDRNDVIRDLHESAVDIPALDLASRLDSHLAEAESANQRAVARRNPDLAVEQRQNHKLGGLLQRGLFWSNNDAA